MLKACPCFVSGETEWTEGGTNRHAYLHALYRCEKTGNDGADVFEAEEIASKLDEQEQDACQFFYDYIKLNADISGTPIYFERRMECTLPNFDTIDGTPDVVCGRDLFDLKWRERDYRPQMAAYALAMFEADPSLEFVNVHIGFGAFKKIEFFTLTKEEALNEILQVLEKVQGIDYVKNGSGESVTLVQSEPKPRPCDYCGWCKNRPTCPALTGPAKTVAAGYAEPPLLDTVSSWHPSEMKTAGEIALALTIWREILKPWGASIEHHALKAAMEQGMKLEGFDLKEKEGRKTVDDAVAAFQQLNIPQADFMKCCAVRFSTSKTYPDRLGIVDVYAKANGLKKAPAKRDVMTKLADVLKAGKSSMRLVSTKGEDETDES